MNEQWLATDRQEKVIIFKNDCSYAYGNLRVPFFPRDMETSQQI